MDLPDASLTINGSRYSLSPVGKYGIEGDKADIEVQKLGYLPCRKTIDLRSDTDTQVTCLLVKQ